MLTLILRAKKRGGGEQDGHQREEGRQIIWSENVLMKEN